MIPIAQSSTTISIYQTTQIAKNCGFLAEDILKKLDDELLNNPNLFEDMSKYANNNDDILEKLQDLTKIIDKSLHQSHTFENENEERFEVISEIVQTCPEFLATKDTHGRLPCHVAASVASSSASKYLMLFIEIGLKYSIGGEDSRGGLLITNGHEWNALKCIEDPEVFDVLQKYEPPLFCKADVQKYHLLHNAAGFHRNLKLVKYLYNLDPSCLYQLERSFTVMWYAVCVGGKTTASLEVVQYLIQQHILQDVSNENVGGLFRKLFSNKYVVDMMVKKWGREAAWDCIERALSSSKIDLDKLPLLRQIILLKPEYCSDVIKRFPSLVHIRDPNDSNRLPIHVALETGMKWSLELMYLIAVSHEYVKDVDPVTKLPPFALAAMGTSCDLRTIYHLLHKYPEHVEMSCGSIGGYKKYIPVENCKRRRMNE